MNNNPLVSILIPLYNSEKYISETIQSCLNQTYKNTEIIIVDDGSVDNSLSIAKNFTKTYKNIYVFSQKNQGAPAARNKAFELSKGEYIQYLDADDLLSENKIEEQLKLLKNQKNCISSCSWQYFIRKPGDIIKKKQKIDKSYKNPIDWLTDSWSGKGMGLIHNWLTPRSLINKAGKWNEQLKINQDGEFFCRVLINANKILYSNKASVYYRKTENSVSKTYTYETLKSMLFSYKLYVKHLSPYIKNNPKLKKASASNFSYFYTFVFPEYNDLLKQAEKNINTLGFKKFPLTGGMYFKILSFFVGVKNAAKLRFFINNTKRKT